jgi:CRISPR-associated endonuclease Csn1
MKIDIPLIYTYCYRNDLIKTKEKPDIRLLYLACHHIIKYRGHFLFEGLPSGELPKFKETFGELIETLNRWCGTKIKPAEISSNVEEILTNKKMGVKEKTKKLQEIIIVNEFSNTVKELCNLISGGTANLDKMFGSDDVDLELKSLTFKNTDYDEKRTEYEDKIIQDQIDILDSANKVYRWSLLSDLLSEYKNISEAKIASYNQHGEDLKLLKSILKENLEKYNEVFKLENVTIKDNNKDTPANYVAYSKMYKKEAKDTNTCSQSVFCKYLRGVLKENLAQEDFKDKYSDLVKRINDDTFMPKQTNRDNSLFPNQLHIHELKAILNNVAKHYPFLKEADETGLSPAEKIEKLGTFRIPYYVGPLQKHNDPKINRSWVAKKEDGPITPWNFEDKVDLDESGENFMKNLIGTCTYLPAEKAVPKASLMYQRFMLYDELNTLKINRERLFEINLKLKHEMVEDLFQKPSSTKVTKKKIETYLKKKCLFDKEIELSGVDTDIKSSLKSEVLLKEILGQNMDQKMAEGIVRIITVFGDEKSRVKTKLIKDYSGKLTDEQIEKLSSLRFKDWGRFSEKFLTGVYAPINGKKMNILMALENTS